MRYDSILSGKHCSLSYKELSRPCPQRPETRRTHTLTLPRERNDFPAADGKNKAAQSLGQRGGRARAKALSAKRRKEIAQKAAARGDRSAPCSRSHWIPFAAKRAHFEASSLLSTGFTQWDTRSNAHQCPPRTAGPPGAAHAWPFVRCARLGQRPGGARGSCRSCADSVATIVERGERKRTQDCK